MRFADLIESRPETQAEQAAALDISPSYFSEIKAGRRPSRRLAARMAAYYTPSVGPLSFLDVLAICDRTNPSKPRRRPPPAPGKASGNQRRRGAFSRNGP